MAIWSLWFLLSEHKYLSSSPDQTQVLTDLIVGKVKPKIMPLYIDKPGEGSLSPKASPQTFFRFERISRDAI